MPEEPCDPRVADLEAGLKNHLIEASATFKEIKRDIKCIAVSMERYEPYLKAAMEQRRRLDNLRRAIIEKSIIGAVWAVIVFAAVAVYEYAKRQLNA